MTMIERETMDEDALDEIFGEDGMGENTEQELDFSEDFQGEHEYGHIYESIEGEVGDAADTAAIEDIPSDDPDQMPLDFEEELPESVYGTL